ncbi:TIGR01459 family HAD-type hydrolase [Roseibium sp. MMSF_3412]|uniref:TIGR01459 family HAD-type hydrolase n=1 Tax=Roseibium sp. MMSF_3412 TaxID=3046712 RepID=UPI00273E0F0A|nr:TIGR01459 family HAD-type hydrolase [Roseibium sp. MMSF_3412]
MTSRISGLGEIIGRFDGLLIDQFGVLHDGKTVFAGALPCLRSVAEFGMPVVAITNSGRMKEPNRERLNRFGFTEDLIGEVITSGMVARARIADMLAAGDLAPGDKVLNLTRENDTTVIDGLGLVPSDEPGDAIRLVLISGLKPEEITRETYRRMLGPLAEAGIPAICANPDHVVYANGKAAFGPGRVAQDYEDAGGSVTYAGKPGAEIFRRSLAVLGNPDPEHVLMIGDSHHHDIAGAAALGCRTLLIAGGVQALSSEEGIEPDYSMDALRF